MTASAPIQVSKARKILRRTLSGGALVAALAGLLWLIDRSGDGRPLYWAVVVVLAGAIFETRRMGKLAALDAGPALWLSAIGVLALLNAGIEEWQAARALRQSGFESSGATLADQALVRAYLFAPITALAAYGLYGTRQAGRVYSFARTLAWIVVGALIFMSVHDFGGRGQPELWRSIGALGALAILGLALGTFGKVGVGRSLEVLLLVAWLVPPLPCLWYVWAKWGTSALVAFLVVSKCGDSFGYYVGSTLGRRHPFPKISPGKTVAGCVGSFLGATCVGGVLYACGVFPESRLGLLGGLLASSALNLAAQSGDLLESWVKRRAGVKDSSTVFGPSGGVLDQIDSLLLSVPMALVTWPWIFRAP